MPAFAGLFAPRWREDARGCVVGLTQYSTKHHLARAALEAVCFQVCDVMHAMRADSGVALARLRVDGGMTANALLLQTQADLLGIPVERAANAEATAWGAAIAAGLAVGVWRDVHEVQVKVMAAVAEADAATSATTAVGRVFEPRIGDEQREREMRAWNKAVQRSLNWVDAPAKL